MEYDPALDHLNFAKDKEIISVIGYDKLLYSDKIMKINRFGFSQERNIVITENAIFNFKKKVSNYLNFIKNRDKKTYPIKYHIRSNS